DRETSEYRQRRRARESIGTAGAAGDERRSEGRRRLVALTRRIHEDWDEVSTSLRELRALVAGGGGLPVGTGSQMRATLWLAMLEVRTVAVQGYVSALEQCPSTSAAKIDNDAFRTLAGDVEFRRAVPTEAVVRVLNAVLSAPDRLASDPPRYVQGMNTLLAPFLWVMGESAAFHAFRQFLRNECPLYARPSLPGVHACVQLVDECLAAVDPRLFSHLKRHGAVAKIYAFPAAMTLSASVGPLRQVVRLWDFLLAFGVHMNVVCIVAQLVAMRELLLTTRSPMALLRAWPPLRADAVIRRTREIYDVLPERLRRYIKHHAHDPHLAERLASAPQVADPLSEPAVCTLPSSPRSPFSPFSPRSPAPAALPPPLQQPSLKRDLPLSPDAGAAASACSSSPASRSSSAAGRPRARTFSGMVKRPRTDGRSRTDVQPVGLPVSTLARSPPPYGSIGLGILAPSARADTAPHQQRASSSSGVTRKPRMVRITAAAASPDTRWLPDRKLSADHRDAHH
ncbi:CDC16 protein, partial [Coemansia helicoidea]